MAQVVTSPIRLPLGASDVPDAVAPPPGNPRFPLVDGVRAIAVLLVLAYHASGNGRAYPDWWSAYLVHADVGVTLFFVISGFLLYRPFVAARLAGRPRPSLRRYARRRALRILPAYWLALTVLAISPGLVGVFTGDWWAYYGFLQIYRSEWGLAGLPQAWSLCSEVSFYLALPVLVAVVAALPGRWTRRGLRAEVVLIGGLVLASLAFRYVLLRGSTSIPPASLPGIFTWFAAGMLLAVVSAGRERSERRWAVSAPPYLAELSWLAAAGLYVVMGAKGKDLLPGSPHYARYSLLLFCAYVAIAALVLLPAVFASARSLPARVMGHPAVAWLGLVSYGVFLYHVTVIGELNQHGFPDRIPGPSFLVFLAMTVVISVGCAAISYYVVERPLLRLKERPLASVLGRSARATRLS